MTTLFDTSGSDVQAGRRRTVAEWLKSLLRRQETTATVVLLVLGAFLTFMNPNFLTTRNLTLVARSLSFVGIAGLGGMVVLSSGQLDLSIGSCMGLAGVLAAYLSYNLHVPDVPVFLIALGVGVMFGLANGLLIGKLHLNPFMVTLGTSLAGRGAIYVLTNGWPVNGFSPKLMYLGKGFILGIPVPVWIMLVLGAVFTWLMSCTTYGWHIYAIGSSEESARLSGVNVDRLKLSAYIVVGLMGALGGFLLTARLGTGEVSVATGYELDVMAAAVIGGLKLGGGGKGGTAVGTIIGAAVMAILRNALSLLSVPAQYQQIVVGTAMLLAMAMDRLRGQKG